MWILLVSLCISGCTLEAIPGYYSSLTKCEEAAKAFADTLPPEYSAKYAGCIPAPDAFE